VLRFETQVCEAQVTVTEEYVVLHLWLDLQDVSVKTPIYGMDDVARIKHALAVEGI